METFTMVPRGPFSLASSIRFLEGFTPAAYAPAGDAVLELAFPVEGSWETAGVRVRQDGGEVTAEIVSPRTSGPELATAVRAQVERILSLDVDGSGFPAVGSRDPVVAGLQRRYPGLRPAGFWSPYEAAAWTIIGHRIRISQAAAIKARMAGQLGEPVTFGGRVVHAFPAPARLASLESFPGLAGRKPEWLRSVAMAALDGQLDAARLRGMPRETALKELKTLPGIGDFSAGLILLRGAGDPDAVAYHEPRLALAVADAYGLPGPATTGQLTEISENWRPYRTWVTLLLRTPQEIPAAGALRWGQHVVAPRVPLAVRSCCDHNQDGRAWTERRRDPDSQARGTPDGIEALRAPVQPARGAPLDPSTTLSFTVTLAVLAAAVTHATWNAIAHGIKDQTLAFALIGVGGVAVSIPLVIVAAVPRSSAWPYLLASVAIHVFYNLLLMQCYRLGEFSQVYPLARGMSPLVVTILAAVFVHEHLAIPQIGGVAVVSAGLAFLVFAGRRPGRGAFLAAVGTGLTIAAYTTVDGVGVRASASAVGYIGWLMVLESLCVPLFAAVRRRDVLLKQPRRILLSGLAAGALSVLAYGLVLWAQTRGALAPIAALRETSVIFGAIIGTLVFREPFGRARIIAAVLVVAGIVLLNMA